MTSGMTLAVMLALASAVACSILPLAVARTQALVESDEA